MDGTSRNAAVLRGFGHGRCDLHHQTRIKRLGDQILRAKSQTLARISRGHHFTLLRLRQFGNRINRRNLHLVGDGRCARIQSATEDVGETQHVVHLVVIVAAPRGNDGVIAHGFHFFRRDFRVGVGQGHDDGLGGHAFDHLGFQYTASGQAQENISSFDDVGQGARIRFLCVLDLVFVHQLGTALKDHAGQVGDKNIFAGHPHLEQQAQTGQSRRASA